MDVLLRRVLHAIRSCIARMIKKCYANNSTQDVAKFAAILFMSIAMSDAKGMRGFSPGKSFTFLSLIFCKAIIPNAFKQKFYNPIIKISQKNYIVLYIGVTR